MSWAIGQENTMFPSALAAALWAWLPPKPLPLQPPCPTFPGCLAPPPASALTSPLSRPLFFIDGIRAWLLWGTVRPGYLGLRIRWGLLEC